MPEPLTPHVLPPKSDPPKEEPRGFFDLFMQFLQHDHGRGMAEQLAQLVGAIKTDQDQQHSVRMIHTIARYTVVALILGAAVWLKSVDKLDTTIVGLLSLTVGYLLGQQKSKEG
jgi:hypothetical protein